MDLSGLGALVVVVVGWSSLGRKALLALSCNTKVRMPSLPAVALGRLGETGEGAWCHTHLQKFVDCSEILAVMA